MRAITLMRRPQRPHPSAQSSPDSLESSNSGQRTVSSRLGSSENLQQQHSEPPSDTELLDLWDTTWFGVSMSPPLGLLSHRTSSKYFTADPLAFVVPLTSAAAHQQLLMRSQQQHYGAHVVVPGQMSEHDMSFVMWQQHQQAAAAASKCNMLQQLQQPGYANGSNNTLIVQQQQQQPRAPARQEAPRLQQQQQQQPEGGSPANPQTIPATDEQQQQQLQLPTPFVLGTWAQRQYRMPDQQQQQQQQQADSAQPVPLTGRWAAAAASSSLAAANGKAPPEAAAAAAQLVAAEVAAADAAAAAEQLAGASGGNVIHGSNAAALAAAAAAAAAAGATGLGLGLNSSRRSIGTDEEEELVTQAAWRWRFAKRWQAEQTRAPDAAAAAASAGDGGMEEALQYLAACGENWHLARTTSGEPGTTLDSRNGGLGTLGTPSLLTADLLVDDGSYSGHRGSSGLLQSNGSGGLMGGFLSREVSVSGGGGTGAGRRGAGRGEATQQVTGITRRAQQLLAQQSDINKAVKERWLEVQSVQGSELWVGAVLESVEVDDWGKFKWLLLRMRDRSGRQKLLVRGANYASDAKIIEGLHRQMMAACTAHDVCAEAIEVVGGGVMEWTRHRDRLLHISAGYVSPGSGPGGPSTPAEVMNLAAVLTKQHLPMHYKVTSDGGKAM